VSLLVVGSVAFDALESPYGKVDGRWVARRRILLCSEFFHACKPGWDVGDDFTEVDATDLSRPDH